MNQEWHLNSLYTPILEHLKTFIQGSNNDLNPGVQDLFIWKTSSSGNYTTKAGFHWMLNQRVDIMREQSWNWIWKLPTQENMKSFFWLAFHNSIPTLATLNHRGIIQSIDCRFCLRQEETLLHCIRDCPRVKRLWERLGFEEAAFFQQMNVKSWLKQGATGRNDKLFIATVWWSWKARNAKCFNNEEIPSHRLLLSILNLHATLKACFDKDNNNSQAVRQISWFQQDRKGFILNVDGSSLGNPGPAGFGGLARNPDGGWIFGFSGHIGHSDVLKAELLGISTGLKLSWERGIRELTCYTVLRFFFFFFL